MTPTGAYVGDTLTSTAGSWTSCGEAITYWYSEWLRNGVVISGPTQHSGSPGSLTFQYQVVPADVGQQVRSAVSVCNADNPPPPPCGGLWAYSNIVIPGNRAPNAPTNLLPATGTISTNRTPTLSATFSDPDGSTDTGYIKFTIYRSIGGQVVLTGNSASVHSGSTASWTVPSGSQLATGVSYNWYAQAVDANGATSSSVGPRSYDVPPLAPGLLMPASAATLPTVTPVLSANPASNPSSDTLTYEIQVASDSGFSTIVADSGWNTTTNTWTLPPGLLLDGQSYWWRAKACGLSCPADASGWSSGQSFQIRLPKLGTRDYWPIWSHGPLAVNEANGNLVASIPGPSYPTAVGSMGASLSYDSQSTVSDPNLGLGWSLNAGDQLADPPSKLIDHSVSGASPQLDAVERVSADGSSDYYTRVGSSNTYVAAPGDGSQLTRNADGSFTLLDSDGAIYTFGSAGSGGVAALQSAEIIDASKGSAKLTFSYANGRIASIDAGGGRTVSFNWSCTAALLCITGPDNVSWSYIGDAGGGSSGKLVRVNDGVRDLYQLGYDGSGRLNSIKNANDLDPSHASPNYNGAHALTIAYDGSSRVASVSDGPVTNQSPASSTWSFAYHPGAGTLTSERASHYGYLAVNRLDLEGTLCTQNQFENWLVVGTPLSDCGNLFRDYKACMNARSHGQIGEHIGNHGCYDFAAIGYLKHYGHLPWQAKKGGNAGNILRIVCGGFSINRWYGLLAKGFFAVSKRQAAIALFCMTQVLAGDSEH